jgi:ATP-dependent helicase/nuclease subunit B
MLLQFIFGNSGSGKSTFLYEKILKEAAEHPEQNYLVLVPEQFTMQTQRELVRLQKSHAIMNVDVLSFARLAYRVFDELGKQNLRVLEETGKNLVLRKLAGEQKKNLKVLGGNLNRMGYISEVKSMLSELTQYNISPEKLDTFLASEDIGETLRLKMQDISVMYHSFSEYLKGQYITSEEVLTLLCEVAEDSNIIKNSVIAFDEFTGFTPIQNQLLRKLLVLSERMIVSVTMDTGEDFYHCRGEQELFSMSKKTVSVLMKMADELHIDVEEPVVLSDGKNHRYKNAPSLYFMEQNLFRPYYHKWKKKEDELRLAGLKNPREELQFVAREITKCVREKKYCYKDIAVVTGDVSLYDNYVDEIFGAYDIPYFLDQTRTILFHPLIEFIRAVLEVVEFDFSYESVFRFLRCGLTDITERQIDLLENYVLACGIRGKKKWQEQWTFVLNDAEKENLVEMNAVRAQIYDFFAPLAENFSDGKNVREITTVLYELLEKLQIEQKLKQKELEFEQQGNQVKAKEYAQIYKIVMDLFDKVVDFLGEEVLPVKEYADILDAGFEAAKVGVIPPGNDKVTIGDIERTRLNHIKILFFIGVNDGVVPKAGNTGGIISQFEREKMAACHLELAPGAREKVFIQRFYLYLNVTKPSDFLYVTFSKVNAEGKALRRSYFVGTLLKMFPEKTVEEIEETTSADCIMTPKSSMAFFLEGLQEEAWSGENEKTASEEDQTEEKLSNPAKKEVWNALAKFYLSDENWKEEADRLLKASYVVHSDEPISHAVTKALYGTVLENSVTRLERFVACAYAHYLDYGLRLRERQLLEFASVDMGNIYHDALEHFSKRVEKSEYTWFNIPEDVLIEASMDDAIAGCSNAGAFENVRNRYLTGRMRKTIKRTVWALTTQIQKGKFVPSDFEVSFSRADKLDAIRFKLSEEEKMNLLGRIDRVDTYETEDKVYVKIIDYKSGNTSFSLVNLYHGLQLQLVVYMNAALELEEKRHPGKKAEPAGIFYYHIQNPMVDGLGNETEAEIRNSVLEQLKLNGLVNDDPEIYEAMDTDFAGNSSVIPIGKKTDGSLKATSKVASTYDFSVMSEYVREKIKETGKKIFAGDISIHPYSLDGKSGCDYCPYHTVCGFDARMPGYSYHKLEKFDSAEEVLEKMKEEQ